MTTHALDEPWRDVVGRASALQQELNDMGVDVPDEKPKRSRGTSNGNSNGNSEDRRRRRQYLVDTYRADLDVAYESREFVGMTVTITVPLGQGEAACRCYRCGKLCTVDTVTVDRIKPGCEGGTYRRENIRPACSTCNEKTGAALASKPKAKQKRACPSCGGRSPYRRLIAVNPMDSRRCTDDRHPR